MLALSHALQCKWEPDNCFRTQNYPYPGQNRIIIPNPSGTKTIEKAIDEALVTWFNEYKSITNIEWLMVFGSFDAPWWEFKHFTQMIQGDAAAVGCAIVKSQFVYFITCNYATGNENGSFVFEMGDMGSKCEKGMNPSYTGLCDVGEFHTSGHEVPPVIKWIINGKRIDSEINMTTEYHNGHGRRRNSALRNDAFSLIIILLLNAVIAILFLF